MNKFTILDTKQAGVLQPFQKFPVILIIYIFYPFSNIFFKTLIDRIEQKLNSSTKVNESAAIIYQVLLHCFAFLID